MSVSPGPEVLAQVPGGAEGAPLEVRPLTGGLTNRSFLVVTPQGRYVVRLGTKHDALLAIDRRTEIAAQRLAATRQVAPRIVHADAASGLLIAEYAEGRCWTGADFADPRQIDRLGARLALLHSLDARSVPDLALLDPVALARGYAARIAASVPDERRRLAALVTEAEQRRVGSGALTRKPALVHSDLHGSNLVDGGSLQLIDWEYAALADPLHDVACVLTYYPQAVPHAARLLAALGLEVTATSAALGATIWLFQLLTCLWYRARRLAVPPTPADLAAEQRAVHALVHNKSL